MSDVIDRIRGLLELADNNPSEEEAASAAAMARKLMLRHNITQDDLSEGKDQDLAKYGDVLKNDRDYFRIVAQAAAIATGTQVLLRSTTLIFFVGRKHNIEVAEFIFDWLVNQVESLYKIHLPKGMSKRKRAHFRKDFKRACSARILDRMTEMKRDDRASTGTDLVVMEDKLMDEIEALLQKKGVTKTRKSIKIKIHTRGGRTGYLAGGEAQLDPRVSK